MNKNNILFLNFDKFNNNKVFFFNNVEKIIKKNGGIYKLEHEGYNVHMFFLEYDENLPKYYNQNHRFLWNRMNKKQLEKTRLFEKEEISPFTLLYKVWFSSFLSKNKGVRP